MVTVLGDDFILAAKLRGLNHLTGLRYIARNAMLPLFTFSTVSFGFMFGGAVLIEWIFNYQGLGVLLLDFRTRDFPLMSGAFLLITVAVIVANIIADVLYAVIDPRVRTAPAPRDRGGPGGADPPADPADRRGDPRDLRCRRGRRTVAVRGTVRIDPDIVHPPITGPTRCAPTSPAPMWSRR